MLICSCNKSIVEQPEEQPVELPKIPQILDRENPHLGRWKLMKIAYIHWIADPLRPPPWHPPVDYSESDVFFEFKADSTLVVSGDMNSSGIDWYVERELFDILDRFIKPGIYKYDISYEFIHDISYEEVNGYGLMSLIRQDDFFRIESIIISALTQEAPQMIFGLLIINHHLVKVAEEIKDQE